MKVFLSWSGETSRQIAEVLKQWLPDVIQNLEVFYSPDILRGRRWLDVLRDELQDNSIGLFCITHESLQSLWMSYEAGALVSRNPNAKVVPILFGLPVEAIHQLPYSIFQSTLYSKEEMLKIVESINDSMGHPLESSRLNKYFELLWPELDAKIAPLIPVSSPSGVDVPPLFAQSDQGVFSSVAYQLVSTASTVTLVGTGLCILSQDPIRKVLFERARAKECVVEIYLGNPNSPDLQNRLIEEETGEWSPSVGYDGLKKRAEMLLQEKRNIGNPPEISLNMFNHYPTMAIIKIDEHYFVYPYGYATLGNFSPVMHYMRNDKVYGSLTEYLDRQIEMIRKNASPMELISRTFHKTRSNLRKEESIPLAVYYIPPHDSELYQFGKWALGYDVYSEVSTRNEDSPFPDTEAGRYGFHVTLCDVIYFLTDADLRRVCEEVRFVASSFSSFRISGFHIEKNYPRPGTISLLFDDHSGSLEALHHEFVHRLYRRSAGSNYTFKCSTRAVGPFTERDRLMIEKYRAPHILRSYQPHFTLISDLMENEIDAAYDKLKAEMHRRRIPEAIEVSGLAIMGMGSDGVHLRLSHPVVDLK
jgi:hypothetical protein